MYRGARLGATMEDLTKVAVEAAMTQKSDQVDALLANANQGIDNIDETVSLWKWPVTVAFVVMGAYYLARLTRKRRP